MAFFIIFLIFESSCHNSEEKYEITPKNDFTKSEKNNLSPAESNEGPEITGSCGNNVFYTINKIFGNVSIYGSNEMNNYFHEYESPFNINKKFVKYITVGEGVTTIGYGSFYECYSLISINLSDTIQKIEYNSFYMCNKLSSINLPDAVSTISYYAFYGCSSLQSIIIPKLVKEIPGNLFQNCISLKSVIINGNIETFSYSAFNNCSSLSYLFYKGNIKPTYGNHIFMNCQELKSVDVMYYFQDSDFNGIPINRIQPNISEVTGNCGPNITFKYNVSSCTLDISGSGEMYNFSYTNQTYEDIKRLVKHINIYSNITSIGDNAFRYFDSLVSIDIPQSVKYIGPYAFSYSGLQSINIPYNTDIIYMFTFYYCSSLTSVTIPKSVNSIAGYAFTGCYSLESINIPESVTRISVYAFSQCFSLKSINISLVESLDEGVFQDCANLTTIEISNSINYIPERFFERCSKLSSFHIPEKVYKIGSSSFSECISLTSIVIPNDVTIMAGFANCISLKSINIPPTVTNIYYECFYNCSSLTSISLPDSLPYIEMSTFSNCVSLVSINIPEQTTRIEKNAFANCSSLTSIIIPLKTVSIGGQAFDGCISLSYVLYKGINEPRIKYNAFYNCDQLKLIDVHDYYDDDKFLSFPIRKIDSNETLQINESCNENISYTIDKMAKSLTFHGFGPMPDYTDSRRPPYSIYMPFIKYAFIDDLITSIGSYAFFEFKNLVSINYTDSVKTIGIFTFYHCHSLSEIKILDSITSIGKNSFSSCVSLKTIIIPSSVTKLNDGVFSSCSNLSTVIIQGNITFGSLVFINCPSLSYIFYKGYNEPNTSINEFSKCPNIKLIDVMPYYNGTTFSNFTVRKIESTEQMDINGSCGANLFYTLNPLIGNLTIYGNGPMNDYASSSESPFLRNVKHIFIDSGVTSIGNHAFHQCTSLLTVKLPESVTSIGQYSFHNCQSLSEIVLPNVTTYKYVPFYNCTALRSVYIYANEPKINYNVFALCISISYILYTGVDEVVASGVFEHSNYCVLAEVMYYYRSKRFCDGPFKRIIPENPVKTGKCGENVTYSFDYRTNNLTILGTGNMTNYDKYLDSPFYELGYVIKHVDFGENVSTVGVNAFSYADALESITFHGNVLRIHRYAISCRKSLKYISYKGNLCPIMGYSVNDYCNSFERIDVPYNFNEEIFYGTPVNRLPPDVPEITGECGENLTYRYETSSSVLTISGSGNMNDFDSSHSAFTEIRYIVKHINIGENVTSVSDYSFYWFKSLESINLSFVKSIGTYAFYNCIKLSSVHIPDTVIQIGNNAFANCNSLKSINLPFVKSIGNGTFYNCSSLTSIDIPDTITRIESETFANCSLLTTINFSFVKSIGNGAFDNCTSLSSIVIPETVELIENYVFANCYSLKSINLSFVKSIGNGAFYNCTSLSSIVIPDTVELIENYVFANCNSLKSINLSFIDSIGNGLFFNCTQLSSIHIPSTVKKIGNQAFSDCENILSIIIPENVTTIGEQAFANCTLLETVIINGDLQNIFDSAFFGCFNITNFQYKGKTPPEYSTGVFDQCFQLKSINVMYHYDDSAFCDIPINRMIPTNPEFSGECGTNLSYVYNINSNVLTISGSGNMNNYNSTYRPFEDFRFMVKYINIAESVTSIGDYAFFSFKSIVSIDIPNNIETIGNNAFSNCKLLEKMTMNGRINSISEYAFCNCSSLSYLLYKGYEQPTIANNAFEGCDNLTIVDVMSYYTGDKFGGLQIRKESIIQSSIQSDDEDNNGSSIELTITSEISNTENSDVIQSSNTLNDESNIEKSSVDLSRPIDESENSNIIQSSKISLDESSEVNGDTTTESSEVNGGTTTESSEVNGVTTTESSEDPSTDSVIPIECGSNGPVGCLLCNKNNPSQCLSCDTHQFFKEEVGRDGNCQCISKYELDETNKCVPEITRCDQIAINRGCTLCYLLNRTICAECDTNRGFKSDPTIDNTCECSNQDYNISGNRCVELSVPCNWGNDDPVIGCKFCHGHHPNQCTVCDESKGFVFNNDTHTCECQYDGYEINSQGQCTRPTTSDCNEQEMIGCIKCNENNDHQCITCDSSKGFTLKSDNCICAVEGYEINGEGLCSPPSESLCIANVSITGCLKCSAENNQQCSVCDSSLHFNQNPNNNGICTCQNDYALSVNGECFEYVEEEPVLSFDKYIGKKEIDDACISLVESILTINTNKINKEEIDDYKLYEKEIDLSVTDIKIEQNTLENIQITTNNRKDVELNIQIEANQKIQLDTSNSDFPIKLPSNSKNINIKVEKAGSTLEVKSSDANVNLGNVSISENTFVIKPKTNVIVEIVNLFGSSQISSTSQDDDNKISKITAKKVNIQKGSESQISNVLISEQLNFAPNSVISISDDVDFKSAEFSIYKANSQRIDHSYIKFIQKVTQFPKRIKINKMNANSFLGKDEDEDKVIIIHQNKDIFDDEMCKKWAEQVNDPNGYKGNCITNDLNNDGHNSVYAVKETRKPDDENSKPNEKGSGLSGGAIAGIVIGCIVAVAIVAVFIYFFVFKKRKQAESSIEDEDNESHRKNDLDNQVTI